MARKHVSTNTKIIIVLSIAAILIVFSTNVLPDLIQNESATKPNEYHYETTFPVGRPSETKMENLTKNP